MDNDGDGTQEVVGEGIEEVVGEGIEEVVGEGIEGGSSPSGLSERMDGASMEEENVHGELAAAAGAVAAATAKRKPCGESPNQKDFIKKLKLAGKHGLARQVKGGLVDMGKVLAGMQADGLPSEAIILFSDYIRKGGFVKGSGWISVEDVAADLCLEPTPHSEKSFDLTKKKLGDALSVFFGGPSAKLKHAEILDEWSKDYLLSSADFTRARTAEEVSVGAFYEQRKIMEESTDVGAHCKKFVSIVKANSNEGNKAVYLLGFGVRKMRQQERTWHEISVALHWSRRHLARCVEFADFMDPWPLMLRLMIPYTTILSFSKGLTTFLYNDAGAAKKWSNGEWGEHEYSCVICGELPREYVMCGFCAKIYCSNKPCAVAAKLTLNTAENAWDCCHGEYEVDDEDLDKNEGDEVDEGL